MAFAGARVDIAVTIVVAGNAQILIRENTIGGESRKRGRKTLEILFFILGDAAEKRSDIVFRKTNRSP
jgi:hypothetical protein